MSKEHSGPGVFHIGQTHLTPVTPVPEHGGKVCLGLIPEEFFQFLYPRTVVTGHSCLELCLACIFYPKKCDYTRDLSTISVVGLIVNMIKKYGASIGEFIDKLNE